MLTCVLVLLTTGSRDSQIQPRAIYRGALPGDLAVLTNRIRQEAIPRLVTELR